MFDTKSYEQKMNTALEHFEADLKKVRTGRAHPDMLASVMVEAYGQKMPLNQVANVTAPEPQSLLVSPFDPSNIAAITNAIREDQSLGFNPSDDGRVVRVPIPSLTEERRREMVKQLGDKVEHCRIQMRQVRQDAFKDAKRKKEAKEMSENDVARFEKEIDKLMSDFQVKIDEAFKAKEQEILTI
ncbi:MAG TPA: ribosome recycling factor [Candidatus Saccharibacteria bacterium]|nr:ribosome recycling factor [Candidatus Saccharibacteria bacterium]HRK94336.1 ribosome recycling factor [Candidatus Saccharibacteria bacterium]